MSRPRYAFVLALVGCGPDLPDGWEDAAPVEAFAQSACDGTPYEAFDTRVSSTLEADLTIEVLDARFRCEQAAEAFWHEVDGGVEVLVQPVDMRPGAVAGCDCLFDLEIGVGTLDETPSQVAVYQRQDRLNEPNPVSLIGEVR